jgi:hypothetical protein
VFEIAQARAWLATRLYDLLGPRPVRQIFLLNPPYSGSTAMAALLLKSPRAWCAWPDAEGQWVLAVRAEMRRAPWDPAVDFDWDRIRKVWLKAKPADKSILVEKSPPNLLRVRSIMKAFPDSVFVISNRNPYAWLASVLHREHRAALESAPRRRDAIVAELARWVMMARRQIENLELVRGRGLITTYEIFCAAPQLLIRNLAGYCGDLGIDRNARLQVKDYPEQGVVNMNAAQTARLDPEDIALAGEALREARAELEFFGYGDTIEPAGPRDSRDC